MRKNILLAFFLIAFVLQSKAQVSGNFIVQGDVGKYYPVVFYDGGWDNNDVTQLTLGRSSVHIDATWRGSCIGYFRIHTNNWGNSSGFIDAEIRQFSQPAGSDPLRFIAGWHDATGSNGDKKVIIWLKGGGTTYFYHSNYPVNPVVYDGGVNGLTYQETNGASYTYKTSVDTYVNNAGMTYTHSAWFGGGLRVGNDNEIFFGDNGQIRSLDDNHRILFRRAENKMELREYGSIVFSAGATGGTETAKMVISGNGYVGIGTASPQSELAVNGTVTTKKVKVTQTGWSDYVFNDDYHLRPLNEVEKYIQQNHHLPEVPSAEEVKKDGLDVGDNQATLLKKIEELTLYVIDQNKKLQELDQRLVEYKHENDQLKEVLKNNQKMK